MQVILVWNADSVFCRISLCPESCQSNQNSISHVLLFCLTSNQTRIQPNTVFAKHVCIKYNPISHLIRLYGWIRLNLRPLNWNETANCNNEDWLVNFLFVHLFLWNFRKCLFSIWNIHNVKSSVNCPQVFIRTVQILEIPAMDTLEAPQSYCSMTACEGISFEQCQ